MKKKELDQVSNIRYDYIYGYIDNIKNFINLCDNNCLSWLEEWNQCDCGTCYDCKYNNGTFYDHYRCGKCQHYYKIEEGFNC